MFENIDIERKIENSPLQSLRLEILFNTRLSLENLYGRLYSDLFDDFCKNVQTLPLAQIPQIIRDSDPNLKYQPIYRGENNKHHIILLGQHSLVFEHLFPYTSWAEWSPIFYAKLKSFLEKGEVENISKFHLQSQDTFVENIVDKLNFNVSVNDENICDMPISFSSEIIVGKDTASFELKTLKFVPKIVGKNVQCLMIIKSSKNFKDKELLKFDDYKKEIENLHDNNKRVFWGLVEKLY